MEKIKKKEVLILLAALVIPGGFIALGLWKAAELLTKKKEKNEKSNDVG